MGLGPSCRSTRRGSIATCSTRFQAKTASKVWASSATAKRMSRKRSAPHARLARESRQPHLGHQLQPATARRPSARQREDHSGIRSRFSRRGLERHQGHLGTRLGRIAGGGQRGGPTPQAHGRSSGRRIHEIRRRTRFLHTRAFLRKVSPSGPAGRPPHRRATSKLRRGGHDSRKVYAAYNAALNTRLPTVILAHTIKGYGLGEAGEGRNTTHQQKKLNEKELIEFRDRFGIPISDDDIANDPVLHRPAGTARNSVP